MSVIVASPNGKMRPHFLEHLAHRGIADLHPLGEPASTLLLEALQLDHQQSVLEIGCGTGRSLIRLSARKVQQVVGVDLLPAMLTAARSRLNAADTQIPISLVESSATRLPFLSGIFPRVFSESALCFHPETTARNILAEIYRVLSPGGRFVANEAVWRSDVSAEDVGRIYESCMVDFGLCQASPQPWSVQDWCLVMESTGFRVISAQQLEEMIKAPTDSNISYSPGEKFHMDLNFRLRSFLHPCLLIERIRYRRLLSRHQDDGRAMESRLFILEK